MLNITKYRYKKHRVHVCKKFKCHLKTYTKKEDIPDLAEETKSALENWGTHNVAKFKYLLTS